MQLVYMTDTNLYRYTINDNQQGYQSAATDFWTKAKSEAVNEQAMIMTSKEVERELYVQMQTFAADKQAALESLLENITKHEHQLSVELEYDLRWFSNYIRTDPFRSYLAISGYGMNYLKTSDARIMVDAYMNDAVLVTANVKDFIPYLLFTDASEDKLYDFLNKRFIHVPPAGRALVQADPHFKSLNAKLEALFPAKS